MNSLAEFSELNKPVQLQPVEQFNQPDELTHLMKITVVSIDGTIREIALRYCQTDMWMNGTGYLKNAQTISGYLIPVIARDKNAVTVLIEIIELKTMERVYLFPPCCLDNQCKDMFTGIKNRLLNTSN